MGVSGVRIDELIAQRYADLSPQQRRAADMMLANVADLATYNAAELAEMAGVSKATMSRLFRDLGFDDFAEVREHVRGLRSAGLPVSLDGPPSLTHHLDQETANLQRTLGALDESVLDDVVARLASAPQVVVVGQRNSYPVALHLRQQLAQARPGVSLAPQPGQTIADDVVGLGRDDVVVLVGFRRRTQTFGELLDTIVAGGAYVVLIADPSARLHARSADVWFEVPIETTRAFDSYAAAMSLVAVLADGVLDHTGRAGGRRVTAIDAAYRDLREIEGG